MVQLGRRIFDNDAFEATIRRVTRCGIDARAGGYARKYERIQSQIQEHPAPIHSNPDDWKVMIDDPDDEGQRH